MAGTITLANLIIRMQADASDLLTDLKGVGKNVDQMAARMKSAGQGMTDFGKSMSLRVTAPLLAVGAASIKMASDAEEAANKFDVVMGEAADEVRSKLQLLTATIPLTRAEMEQMAAGIQDMLVPMGVARSEAAGMSADMVGLAGDLASFNNVPTTEVLMAMQSALAGSSEPMRRFGVDTRVTRLQALALSEGLIKQGEELDNTSTAMAVLLAIQEDSTDAMGDAARTVDSTANSIKFLIRDVKQLALELGAALIPVVTPLIQMLGDLVAWFSQLSPGVKTTILVVGGLVAAIGPLLIVLGQLTVAVGALLPIIAGISAPVGLAIAAFAAVTAAIVAVVAHWDILVFETKAAIKNFLRLVQRDLAQPFQFIVDIILGTINLLIKGFNQFAKIVGKETIPELEFDVTSAFDRMIDGISTSTRDGTEEVAEHFVELKDDVAATSMEQLAQVTGTYEEMRNDIGATTNAMKNEIDAAFLDIKNEMVTSMGQAQVEVTGEVEKLREEVTSTLDQTAEETAATWDGLTDFLQSDSADAVTNMLKEFGILPEEMGGVVGQIQEIWSTLDNVLSEPTLNALQDWKDFIGGLIKVFTNFWDKVGGIVSNIASAFQRQQAGLGGSLGTMNPVPITIAGGLGIDYVKMANAVMAGVQSMTDVLVEIRDLLTPTVSTVSGMSLAGGVSAQGATEFSFVFVNRGTIQADSPGAFGADMAEGFIVRVDEALGVRTDRERRFRGDARIVR
jgi:hypothetical protein